MNGGVQKREWIRLDIVAEAITKVFGPDVEVEFGGSHFKVVGAHTLAMRPVNLSYKEGHSLTSTRDALSEEIPGGSFTLRRWLGLRYLWVHDWRMATLQTNLCDNCASYVEKPIGLMYDELDDVTADELRVVETIEAVFDRSTHNQVNYIRKFGISALADLADVTGYEDWERTGPCSSPFADCEEAPPYVVDLSEEL